MKTASRLLLLSAMCFAATSVAAANRLVDGFPELPKDARDVAERATSCSYFAGEINGEGGQRDREITKKMRKLKCDTLERDLDRMQKKYRDQPEIIRILEEVEEDSGL